jgi:formate hydrogenlyase transcriptional activator
MLMTITEGEQVNSRLAGSAEIEFGIDGQRTHKSAHVAYFWETEEEFAAAVRFLEAGLRGRDHCVIFGHEEANRKVCRHLEELGFDTEMLSRAGRITVLGGRPLGDDILQSIGAAFQQAVENGAPLIRLLGNIGWGKPGWPEDADLLAFEAKVTDAAQQFPCVVVCMYDAPALSGHVIHHGGFESHPYLKSVSAPLRENPFYIPAETFLQRVEAIAAEVAERKRRDDALRRSEQRFRSLFDHSIDAVFIANPDWTIEAANPEACRLFGRSEEEICRIGRAGLVDSTDSQLEALVKEREQTGRFKGEITFRRKDGAIFLGEVSSALYQDISGETKAAVIVRDVTERKRAEEALLTSEKRLRMLLDINNAIVTKLTRDELFVAIAEAVARTLPFDRLALSRYDPKSESLRIVTYAGPYQRADYSPIGRVLALNDSPAGLALLHQKPVIRSDLETERITSSEERAYGHGFRSICALPLIVRGMGIGALTVGSLTRRQYSEADGDFLMEVANQIAIAVDNMSSHEETEALKARFEAEAVYLQEEIKTEHNFEEIIGQSAPVRELLRKIEQVAPTEATVLIHGETGAGKELIARAVHDRSRRKDRPLVKVNCGSIPSGLVESELFGHEKGAFTGATQRRIGRFELADGGTIFLDEVTELPIDTQVKLLRVLQEGEFERVGSSQTLKVDVRVIAATNRDLQEVVRNGMFRADLYYRLNVFPLEVPPLRDRKGDIPLLVNFFLSRFGKKLGKEIHGVSQKAMASLTNYSWPGNIRELQNVVERAVVLASGPIVNVDDSMMRADNGAQVSSVETLENVERNHILRALNETAWVIHGKKGAAEILGINPSTLRSRMEKLGIKRTQK